MAASVGERVATDIGGGPLARAKQRAALVPDLLIEASRIANNVISGWHGRRKRGIGDNFWQFRPYVAGETLAKIDWRRSARDDHIYVRDREWEAAHTIWVWADPSQSMLYKSRMATVSKQSRAHVLALALCDLLSRGGERVGWPGLSRPYSNRNAAEKIAMELVAARSVHEKMHTIDIRQHADLVIFSDFLDPLSEIYRESQVLAQRNVRGHFVQIVDPAEETFPYAGRVEFEDPETGNRLTAGRAEQFKADYSRRFQSRKDELKQHAQRMGWTHIVHHTDRPASEALVALHAVLSGNFTFKGGGQ
ncbi:MAG: DUF58 domain-containing protein [Pseudomonadota bacterium]